MVNFSLWKDALLKPKETFQKEKANSSIKSGVVNILVASVILSIMVVVLETVFAIPQSIAGAGVIFTIITIFLLFIVGGLIGSFISVGIIWGIARLLGGKGSFAQQYYLTALFTAPLLVLLIINVIPFGIFIMLLAVLYSIYLIYLVVNEVHGLSTGKTISLIFSILLVILFILFILFILLISLSPLGPV